MVAKQIAQCSRGKAERLNFRKFRGLVTYHPLVFEERRPRPSIELRRSPLPPKSVGREGQTP